MRALLFAMLATIAVVTALRVAPPAPPLANVKASDAKAPKTPLPPYTNSEDLFDGNYNIQWVVDLTMQSIRLRFEVKTANWIGFGISEMTSGSMPGTDMMIAEFTPDGRVNVSDHFATAKAHPPQDQCNDWVTVCRGFPFPFSLSVLLSVADDLVVVVVVVVVRYFLVRSCGDV